MAENFSELFGNISNEVVESLAIEGKNFPQTYFGEIQLKVSLYLLEAKSIMEKFNDELSLFNLYNDQDMSDTYKRWLVASRMKTSDIEQTLKKGYLLIDQLRQAVTGEELKYYVGVTTGRQHLLHEGFLTIQQILSMARLEVIWKNTANSVFKLRLHSSKTNLTDMLRPASSGHQRLYGYIREYASKNKIRNEGNIFEAYRNMVKLGEEWDPDQFDDIMMSVKKNTASFVLGGDLEDESIKFFGGSSPSLASLSTIITALTEFNEVLSLANIESVKSGLQLLFQKSSAIKEIEKDFQNFANETLEEDVLKGFLNN